ncbi:MAG: hypothetical protein JST85_22470 [Acidobacteria bacterium]|nr:hypothetical protein [Acidobacteriota bacterium]
MSDSYIAYVFMGLVGRLGKRTNYLVAYFGEAREMRKVSAPIRKLESAYYVRFKASGFGHSPKEALDSALRRLLEKGDDAVMQKGDCLKAPVYDLMPQDPGQLGELSYPINGGTVCFYHAGHLT